MTVIGSTLARLANKTSFYKKVLDETQHKHVNVHKGAPKDRYQVPVLYTLTTLCVGYALKGAWDMLMNKNKKE